jgi:hypothetical protein
LGFLVRIFKRAQRQWLVGLGRRSANLLLATIHYPLTTAFFWRKCVGIEPTGPP